MRSRPDPDRDRGNRNALVLGGVLVVVGVLALLEQIGLLDRVEWRFVWPLLLIAAGVALMVRRLW
jgi:dipeptide/tripeptide permease